MEPPIAIAIRWRSIPRFRGEQIRNPWYDTTCCPPNLERTFASLPGYFYSTSKDGLYVHLYDNSTFDWHLENGTPLKIEQKTNYPWDGDVKVTVSPSEPADFTVNLRIPGWAKSAKVTVNGKAFEGAKPGQYLTIKRRWLPGDTVTLALPMAPEIVASNPRVDDNLGRVAVQRGPIVYCMEGLDQQRPRTFRKSPLSSIRIPEILRGRAQAGVAGRRHGAEAQRRGLRSRFRQRCVVCGRHCGGAEDAGGELDADSVLRLGESQADGDGGLDSGESSLTAIGRSRIGNVLLGIYTPYVL